MEIVRDREGSAASVILGSFPFVIFRQFEEWQHILIAPTCVAQEVPMIAIAAVPANVDHRVDRAAAAQTLSPVSRNFAAVPVGLGSVVYFQSSCTSRISAN